MINTLNGLELFVSQKDGKWNYEKEVYFTLNDEKIIIQKNEKVIVMIDTRNSHLQQIM